MKISYSHCLHCGDTLEVQYNESSCTILYFCDIDCHNAWSKKQEELDESECNGITEGGDLILMVC